MKKIILTAAIFLSSCVTKSIYEDRVVLKGNSYFQGHYNKKNKNWIFSNSGVFCRGSYTYDSKEVRPATWWDEFKYDYLWIMEWC